MSTDQFQKKAKSPLFVFKRFDSYKDATEIQRAIKKASREELDWLNCSGAVMKNIKDIEETCDGKIYLLLMGRLFPKAFGIARQETEKLNLAKWKRNSRSRESPDQNWNILNLTLSKLQVVIPALIDVQKVIQKDQKQTYWFLTWFRRFYILNSTEMMMEMAAIANFVKKKGETDKRKATVEIFLSERRVKQLEKEGKGISKFKRKKRREHDAVIMQEKEKLENRSRETELVRGVFLKMNLQRMDKSYELEQELVKLQDEIREAEKRRQRVCWIRKKALRAEIIKKSKEVAKGREELSKLQEAICGIDMGRIPKDDDKKRDLFRALTSRVN